MTFEEKLLRWRNDLKIKRLERKCYEALDHLHKFDRLMSEVRKEIETDAVKENS